MQVLLCLEPGYVDIAALIAENLDPDESAPGHDGLHKSEVETPTHDNA